MEVAQTNLSDTPIPDRTYSSQQLSPKSRIEGNGQVTTDSSGNATFTITHNLPYPPVHLVYFNPGNTNAVLHPGVQYWIDAEKSTTWGLMDNFTLSMFADTIKLRGVISGGIPNRLYKYKYFIFVEPAK